MRIEINKKRQQSCLAIASVLTWYLLIPPVAGTQGVNSTASLATWNRAGSYNSQPECQAAQGNLAGMLGRTQVPDQQRTQGVLAIQRSLCVASSDFRLEATQSPAGQPTTQVSGQQGLLQSRP